jgi:predicted GNAT superfamily acetyltransferase
MIIRALRSIAEFRRVIALEQEIWGYSDAEDAVGTPMFVVTVKRGGILLGACDGDRLIGFVYSIAGLRHGRPMQWSHMLGVLPAYRATGIGRALKLEQRRISLDMGLDLMEWTYDPLVAANAHLNVRRLGVVVEEYALNVYGDSNSPLHRGTPTDRFVAQWWMRSPRVARMLDAPRIPEPEPRIPNPEPRIRDAPVVNTVERSGDGLVCTGHVLGRTDPELEVVIPGAFNGMLERRPERAHAWRMATREIFTHYFSRGYRVVDFSFSPGGDEGRYLLRLADAGRGAEPDSGM